MRTWGWKTISLGIIAALALLWFVQAPILSSFLSKTLGMRVSIGTVSVRPSQMKIKYFRIDNPYRYKSSYAMVAESIHSTYEWKKLQDNPRIIDQIHIDHIDLTIELANQLGTQNNWSDLISRIPKKEHAKEVVINKLILTNLKVDILGSGLFVKNQTLNIDRMEFTNVSSNEGFPMREMISQIFGNANLLDYIRNIVPKGPGEVIKKLLPFGTSTNEKGQEILAPRKTRQSGLD
jgi:hypothetical protein